MKPSLILCFFLLMVKPAFTQEENIKTSKLELTCKIWGFLKYYHPQVATGKLNWDSELLKILPEIRNSNTKEDISKVFLNWIESLGEVKKCSTCSNSNLKTDYFEKNFDLSWLEVEPMFTERLRETLIFIKNNRYVGKHKYVTQDKRSGKVLFTNEPVYNQFNWQDQNLRILVLFKYWNMIEYFYPYKYMMDQNWNSVLKEMIPKFLSPSTELDYHLAMLEIVVKLDDSHASLSTVLIDDYFGTKYIPAIFQLVEKKAVITGFYNDSLAAINDLRIGDVIVKSDDVSIPEIISKNENYIQGSNRRAKEAYSWNKIFNGTKDSVRLEVQRNGATILKVVGRYLFKDFDFKKKMRPKAKILEGNIGYMDLSATENQDFSQMADSLFHTKALIMDIRNYPKTWVLNALSVLNPNDDEPFYKALVPDVGFPGKFKWITGDMYQNKREKKYKGAIVLLVNERTISYAEFISMYLQSSPNVKTIGSTTLAANGDVSPISIVGEFKTQMSGIGIFYPDGTVTQRKGVTIDIVVKPSIDKLSQGIDEQLERAILEINK